MTKDFRASQVETSKLIASGGIAGTTVGIAVYSGSIADRLGIISCFINLAKMGFKLAIIGRTNNDTYKLLNKIPNIYLLGALELDEICKIYAISLSGLNFTPDKYIFGILFKSL